MHVGLHPPRELFRFTHGNREMFTTLDERGPWDFAAVWASSIWHALAEGWDYGGRALSLVMPPDPKFSYRVPDKSS